MRPSNAYVEVPYSILQPLFERAAEIIDDRNNAEEHRWFRMTRWQRWLWGPKPQKRGEWIKREMDTIMLARSYGANPRILTSADFLRTVIDIVDTGKVSL